MKFVFIIGSLLVVLVANANPIDSIRTEKQEGKLYVVHEVEEEETIYSLARRYKGTVTTIIERNKIVDNRIEIDQILYILIESEKPFEKTDSLDTTVSTSKKIHQVQEGETLYSIAKKYGVPLKKIKKWNNLTQNNIYSGLELQISEEESLPKIEKMATEEQIVLTDSTKTDSLETKKYAFIDFEKYLVQTDETIVTIANKIGIDADSLKKWNNLKDDYLKIGQNLYYKSLEEVQNILSTESNNKTQIDENGFQYIHEEGLASVIETTKKTTRFLALHRFLPIGTNVEVRNIMNNQTVHVKVVGKLPDVGLNKKLLLRLSQPAYNQLGILDSKSRVEISYSKQ